MSELLSTEVLQSQLAQSASALSAALARAEEAEAEARLCHIAIRQHENARNLFQPQRELLQAITNNVLAAILVLDCQELRAKWANPACRQLLDEPYRTQVDIVGLPVQQFLPGTEELGLVQMLREVASTGRPQSDPESGYAGFARGTTYWRWSIVPLHATPEACPDLLLVASEVTEQVVRRQQVEDLAERLAAGQRFLSTIMDNVPSAIVYVDQDLIIRQCNQAAAANMQQPVERIVGRHWRELQPDNPQVGEAIEGVLRSGQAFRSEELPIRWPDRPEEGTQYYSVAFLPDMDASGQVRGVIAQAQRVTALVDARQKLQAANDRLEERVRERTAELAETVEALRTSREELRAYSRRLVEAVESERRSLARELHDQAGQSLSALTLSLGRLRREVDADGRHAPRFAEIEQLVDVVTDDLHHLALSLRPASLDRYGLLPALQQYADACRQQSGLDVHVVAVGIEQQRLPAGVETALYRVIQEALTNVVRHARAKRVDVMLQRNRERVVAIIEDDGQGFDLDEALHRGRLGLVGMRERAETLGGSLVIESAPGKGTTVFANLPCALTELAV